MKHTISFLHFLLCAALLPQDIHAQNTCQTKFLPVLHAYTDTVSYMEDGRTFQGYWIVEHEKHPDVKETTANHITFFNSNDTLEFTVKQGDINDFIIINSSGDSALTRIVGVSANILGNPPSWITEVMPSGKLTREQAAFDIDALAYTLSEVHPDMFAVCRQADFLSAVARVKQSLPDSLTAVELFRRAAPLVTMIGDGHTSMYFPYNTYFTPERKRLPMRVEVTADGRLTALSSVGGTVPDGAEIVSINGHATADMIKAMLRYESGERDFFRMARLNNDFHALFGMMHEADEYDVAYRTSEDGRTLHAMMKAATYDEMKRLTPEKGNEKTPAPYSFKILKDKNTAVMDFRSFENPEAMAAFADSMFTAISRKGIHNLIIDIRQNGGGNSAVGDVLLRYISSKPFIQMAAAMTRITPTTQRLMGNRTMLTGIYFFESGDSAGFIKPLTAEEGRFKGRVYLLTSHKTFSSASSFSWAFKEFGMGTVVGEETGGMSVAFGDILPYRLPVSKLPCTISYKRFWLPGGDENDIHGTLPDYEVKQQDALDKALQLISEKR